MASSQLMSLPHELLHKLLSECQPADLPNLSATCKGLTRFLSDNRRLYKQVYLRCLDPPQTEIDWVQEVKEFAFFKYLIETNNVEIKEKNLPFLARKASDYLSYSSPNQDFSDTISLFSQILDNTWNRETLLCNSSLFQRVRSSASNPKFDALEPPRYTLSEEQRQASAKLHSLYGIPLYTALQTCPSRPRTRSGRTYPFAVSKVYDLRNYTDGSFWGPFHDDGQATMDWEKIEAILVVLGHNIREFAEKSTGRMRTICSSIWKEPWKDAVKNSCTAQHEPRLEEPGFSLDARDPYDVTGIYLRIVCFLDFTELFTYNFNHPHPPPDEVPRPPLDTVEATRFIVMDLKVTKIEQPGEDDGQDYPVVHFRGTSRSLDSSFDPNASSNIRGTVRQTPEGEIRWTTYSIYHGQERWKSEVIQIGGIRSARGAIGNWFDKDYDLHGPVGPTAFWKVSEEMLAEMVDEDSEEEEDVESGNVLEIALVDAVSDSTGNGDSIGNGDMGVLNFLGARVEA